MVVVRIRLATRLALNEQALCRIVGYDIGMVLVIGWYALDLVVMISAIQRHLYCWMTGVMYWWCAQIYHKGFRVLRENGAISRHTMSDTCVVGSICLLFFCRNSYDLMFHVSAGRAFGTSIDLRE